MAQPDGLDDIKRAMQSPGSATSDFDLNPDVPLPANRELRPAAVLVALMPTDLGSQIILTKRAASMVHHPGQIAFAGGKVEASDNGPIQAALREANEEIGLMPHNAKVLGVLPLHETVTGFSVTPVVASVLRPFKPNLEPDEVAEVFSVPLSHVTDPERFRVQSRYWQGTRRYYHTVPYGPYYIWGATARILHALAQRIAP